MKTVFYALQKPLQAMSHRREIRMQKIKRVLLVLVAVLLIAVLVLLLLLCVTPARASLEARSVFVAVYPLSVEMEDGSVRHAEYLGFQTCRRHLREWSDRVRDYGGLVAGCYPVDQ